MAHEQLIYGIMESLVIADKHIVGDIMASKKSGRKAHRLPIMRIRFSRTIAG